VEGFDASLSSRIYTMEVIMASKDILVKKFVVGLTLEERWGA
jgi:hypothetical protein